MTCLLVEVLPFNTYYISIHKKLVGGILNTSPMIDSMIPRLFFTCGDNQRQEDKRRHPLASHERSFACLVFLLRQGYFSKSGVYYRSCFRVGTNRIVIIWQYVYCTKKYSEKRQWCLFFISCHYRNERCYWQYVTVSRAMHRRSDVVALSSWQLVPDVLLLLQFPWPCLDVWYPLR